jgi:hypothetical protein
MGAITQQLMSYGSNSWPGSPVVVHDFAQGSAFNAGGTPCTNYLEAVAEVRDLSGNGRHATQGTAGNRAFFLPAGDGYLLNLVNFNSSADKTFISRGTYLDSALGFTLDAHIAPADWTPAAANVLAGKGEYGSAIGGTQAWKFWLNTAGNLVLGFWAGGGAADATSTANLSANADNSEMWVRAVYVPDTGSGNYSVEFFTSPDGSTWTQLGATVTGVAHNTNANAVEITLGASGWSNDNQTRFIGRYYQFRYYINGVLTVDWRAADSSHLFTWGPLNTGIGGFISYANNAFLIKEDSIFNDGNDTYTYGASFAPGTTWLGAMKASTAVSSNVQMSAFDGASGANPSIPVMDYLTGSTASVMSAADSALSAATGTTAADQAQRNLSMAGNTIADRTGAVITLQSNYFSATPATTSPASGNIAQFMSANPSSGVMTRAIFYGATKPADAALKTWLGGVPGRNMLPFSQDLEQSTWIKDNVSVAPKVEANPLDGLVNASLVTLTGGTTFRLLGRNIAVQPRAYCFSAYVKRPASLPYRYVCLTFGDGVAIYSGIIWDTTTWLPSFTAAGTTGGAIDLGNGWYRLWISFTFASVFANANVNINFTSSGAIAANVSGVGEGAYIWGCQVHPGTTPDPYRPKTVTGSPVRNEV